MSSMLDPGNVMPYASNVGSSSAGTLPNLPSASSRWWCCRRWRRRSSVHCRCLRACSDAGPPSMSARRWCSSAYTGDAPTPTTMASWSSSPPSTSAADRLGRGVKPPGYPGGTSETLALADSVRPPCSVCERDGGAVPPAPATSCCWSGGDTRSSRALPSSSLSSLPTTACAGRQPGGLGIRWRKSVAAVAAASSAAAAASVSARARWAATQFMPMFSAS
mmetsp:Transcript_24221/g.74975  ORF Transcript_24221/g.74975 Transcript_24221/m.74975 type:complete len:220 (-) Transcript_24221:1110-1769(-)